MSCDVSEATESLENEQSSFSNLSVTSPTSQLILQPFCRFIYVTAHSPTLLLLQLRHSSFSSPSFTSPTSQALHLRHLAGRPCEFRWKTALHISSRCLHCWLSTAPFQFNFEQLRVYRCNIVGHLASQHTAVKHL